MRGSIIQQDISKGYIINPLQDSDTVLVNQSDYTVYDGMAGKGSEPNLFCQVVSNFRSIVHNTIH